MFGSRDTRKGEKEPELYMVQAPGKGTRSRTGGYLGSRQTRALRRASAPQGRSPRAKPAAGQFGEKIRVNTEHLIGGGGLRVVPRVGEEDDHGTLGESRKVARAKHGNLSRQRS